MSERDLDMHIQVFILRSHRTAYHATHRLCAVVVNMIRGTNVATLPGELIFTNALC